MARDCNHLVFDVEIRVEGECEDQHEDASEHADDQSNEGEVLGDEFHPAGEQDAPGEFE